MKQLSFQIVFDGDIISGIRTWNNEKVKGIFRGYHNVSKKEEKIVGIIETSYGVFDIYPYSIELIKKNSFNKYLYIS